MNYSFKLPALSKIASRDDLRLNLQFICGMNGFLYASDGHILAKISFKDFCTKESVDEVERVLSGKAIHYLDYKNLEGKKLTSILAKDDFIVATVKGRKNKEIKVPYMNIDENRKISITESGGAALTTPDFDSVIAYDHDTRESTQCKVVFNPDLLNKLGEVAHSIGPNNYDGGVFLNVKTPSSAIFVEPWEDFSKNKSALMLMPVIRS